MTLVIWIVATITTDTSSTCTSNSFGVLILLDTALVVTVITTNALVLTFAPDSVVELVSVQLQLRTSRVQIVPSLA